MFFRPPFSISSRVFLPACISQYLRLNLFTIEHSAFSCWSLEIHPNAAALVSFLVLCCSNQWDKYLVFVKAIFKLFVLLAM